MAAPKDRARGFRAGLSPVKAALIALVVVVVGIYFAFNQGNPFSHPYELNAVFDNASNLKEHSPVRIAGIDVGHVTRVEHYGDSGAARVTMEIDKGGLPIHRDAQLKIRPRIFLEGNFFVDLQPGSPSAPDLKDGAVVPANQTDAPVQFNDLLAALQSDTRADLQTLLQQYSKGLEGSGARGFNRSIRYWEDAYRDSAIANDATLGSEPHDLSRLLRGQGRTFGALSRDERALKDLVTAFNVTANAFAREDDPLRRTMPALQATLTTGTPALQSVDDALPSVRAFSRDALPAAETGGPAIDASLPFVRQSRALLSEAELRGLAADLRPTVPALVRLNEGSLDLFREQGLLSSCTSNVLVPLATKGVPDPDYQSLDGEPFYQSSARGLVGLASESRLHDANSPIQRAAFTVGPQEITTTTDDGKRLFGTSAFPVLGARPARPDHRPAMRPDVPCETQEVPDLNAPSERSERNVQAKPVLDHAAIERRKRAQEQLGLVVQHLRDKAAGRPTIDPLRFDARGLKLEARRLGLEPLPDGRYRRIR
jgi:phospholipid/cholesterol/gamma-HCH transport system substrate-binding protein